MKTLQNVSKTVDNCSKIPLIGSKLNQND